MDEQDGSPPVVKSVVPDALPPAASSAPAAEAPGFNKELQAVAESASACSSPALTPVSPVKPMVGDGGIPMSPGGSSATKRPPGISRRVSSLRHSDSFPRRLFSLSFLSVFFLSLFS